jgi:septal ring factor EnvC (AmiA/AmiB activator)
MMMNIAQSEQEQLEAEIHSLTVANDRLSQEMADLEQHNQNLKKRLQSEGIDVSKSTGLDREKLALAQQIEADQMRHTPQVGKTQSASQQPPSEGTGLESIE